jgi:hypothetical protein
VLAILGAGAFTVLAGNGDRDLVAMASADGADEESRFTLRHIGEAGIAYLAELPFARRITPPGGSSPHDDLLVVHANPRDLERKFRPEMSDGQLRKVMGGTRAAAIAFGHHHVAFVRRVDRTLLADVSAVGNPRDVDLRCKYGFLTWNERHRVWSAEIERLTYPLPETLAQIRASEMPNAETAIRRLLRASYDAA